MNSLLPIFLTGLCALTALARPPHEGGVSMSNPQWLEPADCEKEIEAVQQVGSWIRLPVNWDELQPSADTPVEKWNWNRYDRVIALARPAPPAKPLQVLVILGAVPKWANAGGGYGQPATRPADYQAYCREVVRRYLPKGVTTYQLGNEINLPHPGWSQSPAEYFERFLVPGSAGIRQAGADLHLETRVILGSIAPNTWSKSPHPHDFLTGIYEAAGGNAPDNHKGAWDALAYHPYVNPDPAQPPSAQVNMKDIPDQLHADMVAYHEEAKKLWATEFGTPTHGSNIVSEAVQAAWVDDAIDAWYARPYVGPLLWYTARDKKPDEATTDREDSFGLLHHDFTEKPAYAALKARFHPAPAK